MKNIVKILLENDNKFVITSRRPSQELINFMNDNVVGRKGSIVGTGEEFTSRPYIFNIITNQFRIGHTYAKAHPWYEWARPDKERLIFTMTKEEEFNFLKSKGYVNDIDEEKFKNDTVNYVNQIPAHKLKRFNELFNEIKKKLNQIK